MLQIISVYLNFNGKKGDMNIFFLLFIIFTRPQLKGFSNVMHVRLATQAVCAINVLMASTAIGEGVYLASVTATP